jgi:hypothetical protein
MPTRWPEFRAALEATGRRKVIVARVSRTTCPQVPALDMSADGYEVCGVIDASGSESLIAREAAVATLSSRGVQIRTGFRWLLSWWPTGVATRLPAGHWLQVPSASTRWPGRTCSIPQWTYAMGRMTPPDGFV